MEVSNKKIAYVLSIEESKIAKYLKDLIKKINKKNEAGLAIYAIEHGIVKPKNYTNSLYKKDQNIIYHFDH